MLFRLSSRFFTPIYRSNIPLYMSKKKIQKQRKTACHQSSTVVYAASTLVYSIEEIKQYTREVSCASTIVGLWTYQAKKKRFLRNIYVVQEFQLKRKESYFFLQPIHIFRFSFTAVSATSPSTRLFFVSQLFQSISFIGLRTMFKHYCIHILPRLHREYVFFRVCSNTRTALTIYLLRLSSYNNFPTEINSELCIILSGYALRFKIVSTGEMPYK